MFLLIGIEDCGITIEAYFNTSHVSINLSLNAWKICIPMISIHLMFLLIKALHTYLKRLADFNTSHVSINRRRGI